MVANRILISPPNNLTMSFRHLINSWLACSIRRALLLILCAGWSVQAQSNFDSWTIGDGLPQNSVWTILQTGDGYLWMGTYEGLARFDGVDFKVFDNTNTAEMKSNWVRALAKDRRGNLWVGIENGGLLRVAGDQFAYYSESDGLPSLKVRTLLADNSGNLWIGTDKGLSRMREGRLENFTIRDGLPGELILSLAEDDRGALWIGTDNGLARLKDGKFTVYRQSDGLTNNVINSLAWSQTDGLWVGTSKGLNLRQNNRFVDFGAKSKLSEYVIRTLFQDRGGALWIGSDNRGLMRLTNTETILELKGVNDLPDEKVLSVYVGSDGAVWVGRFKTGLNRLRESRFRTFSQPDGIREDTMRAVFGDRSGNLWFSTEKSVYRMTDGNFKIYALPELSRNSIYTIAEDRAGGVWFAGTAGGLIWRLQNDKFTRLTTKDGMPNNRVAALLGDRAGNVWVGLVGGGLAVWRNGQFTVFKAVDGLVDDDITALYESSDGSLWIGTGNGLSRYKDGKFTNWTTGGGLSSNYIISFYEANDGAMWIGTYDGGLSRFKNGAFARVSSRDGLYDNLAFQILESNGYLWMSGNKGIYRVSLQQLNDFADGSISAVTSYSYGTDDGMLTRECNGASPAGWKTDDGYLWFPTAKGLVRVDGRDTNLQPPSVLIERVQIDNQILPIDAALQITPEQENLEIKYTAIGWTRPRQIRFKYRIENLDRDWTDAGTRRTAYFSHLPAGDYTFRVIADNGDGVWNMEGKSLRFSVLPPFYQTWWFYSLGVLGTLATIFFVYNYRVGQLEKKSAQQELFARQLIQAQEQERKRIAANLHDSLGQQLLVIKNWAMLELAMNADKHESHEALDEISGTASQAIDEVREIIYDLRPYQLDKIGLTKTITYMIEKVAAASNIEFVTKIDAIDDLFDYDSEITLYRIVQECLNNILKHSGAKAATVIIKKEKSRVNLLIEDDGRGFAPELIGVESIGGGFGLTGINERVRMLGGTQTIVSAPDGGTKIIISISIMQKPARSKGAKDTNAEVRTE